MLTGIEINSFQRINFLKADLSKSAIHVISGANEAGKSSMAEAIRFGLRGISPRVKLKGDFGLLIANGKKSGSVELTLDGMVLRRNVRDSKLTTKAPLNFDEVLVDVQLGAEEFPRAEEKKLRSMLNKIFGNDAPEEHMRTRMLAIGIDEDKIVDAIGMFRAGGFDSAEKSAKEEASKLRGRWEQLTNESYGSKKAETWTPEIIGKPAPTDEEIVDAKRQLKEIGDRRDQLNMKLGGLCESQRLQMIAQSANPELLKDHIEKADAALASARGAVELKRTQSGEELTKIRDEIRALENSLAEAQQQATNLECPQCGSALQATATEGVIVLARATKEPKKDALSVPAAVEALTKKKKQFTERKSQCTADVQELEEAFERAQAAAIVAKQKLTDYEAATGQEAVTQEDIDQTAADIESTDVQLAAMKLKVDTYTGLVEALSKANRAKDSAKKIHDDLCLWNKVAEAMSNGPDGIPAELVAKTVKPMNAALARIAETFGVSPVLMYPDLTLWREGMPYQLLSESAQWRANVMVQLALAIVSPLKLVILDRFDVLEPAARGPFIDMLTEYAKEHVDITVMAFGTLKSRPDAEIDGITFHWIQDGQLAA